VSGVSPLQKRHVEHRKLAALVPYARNARTHSEAQVAQIAASMREFGWTNPVLIDERGGIIAGHGRVMAAQSIGLPEVPCIVIDGLTEAQRRALVIADNKLALNAEWDFGLLAAELAELDTGAFDMALTGFSERELEQIATWALGARGGLTDPDAAPAAPDRPVSRAGEVWLLGRHRLACGDATATVSVAALLSGVKPHLMVTDPPYGVEYDPNWRNVEAQKGNLAYAARRVRAVTNDARVDWREAWALFPGDVAYCWHAGRHASKVQDSLEAAGFEIRCQVIWAKSNFPISRGHYHWRHEPCWYAVRKNATAHWSGDRKQTTLWEINLDKNVEGGHSTQKPVECMRRPIENNSNEGQAVYDPFVGSGTTIIAAEMTGRACYAIELDPVYVDVCIKRWQNFTGKKAARESDGALFDELVPAEREAE